MNKLLLGVLLLAGGTALHSCSDEWDDHYSDGGAGSVNATGISLWERLQSMEEYSSFVAKLEEHGYDALLKQNRAFTVYAPDNAAMSAYMADGKYSERDAFLRNHIAYFSHPLSSYTDTTVTMMNEKVMRVRGSMLGTNQEQNIAFVDGQTNLPCRNGLLHGIQGILPYIPNLWEIIDAETADYSKYVHLLDQYVLNEEESTVDSLNEAGQTVYLDSVLTYTNDNWKYVGELDTEDSSYVSLIMTDTAWAAAYRQIERSFLYYPELQAEDFYQENASDANKDSLARYKDAMIRQTILRTLTYRLPQIEQLLQDQYMPESDFISSVSGRRVPKEVLKTFLNRVSPDSVQEASNGRAYIVHSYDFANYDVVQDTITTEGENSSRMLRTTANGLITSTARLNTDTLSYSKIGETLEELPNNVEYYVPGMINGKEEKHEVSGSEYLVVGGASTSAGVIMGVSGTYSGQYDVWVTFIPASMVSGVIDPKPASVMVTTQYSTVRNNSISFQNVRTGNFDIDPRAVTKVKVGTIDLGACFHGFLDSNEALYEDEEDVTGSDLMNKKYGVKLTIQNRSTNATEFDRNLYIDCIELVPHRGE